LQTEAFAVKNNVTFTFVAEPMNSQAHRKKTVSLRSVGVVVICCGLAALSYYYYPHDKSDKASGSAANNSNHAADAGNLKELPLDSAQKQRLSSLAGAISDEQQPAEARRGQLVLTCPDAAAWRKLRALAKRHGLVVLDADQRSLSFLISAKPGNLDLLQKLAGGLINNMELDWIVRVPEQQQIPFDPTARTVGRQLLNLLGLKELPPNAGFGVKIAIIDTGISINLGGGQRDFASYDISKVSAAPADHANMVASLIWGNDRLGVQGLAPHSELISVRITDENNQASSWTLSKGILQAIDAGAQIINISMGSNNPSSSVQNAINEALRAGVVVVAAAGNEAANSLAYPAGYEGVLSVAAIDGNSVPTNFSNRAQNLVLSAPGYGLLAEDGTQQQVLFSGTSAAAPVVSAAIATVMSSMGINSATKASELVVRYSNDLGMAGHDIRSGVGALNVGRVLESNQQGIVDVAISGQTLLGDTLVTSVQNRGTTALGEVQVSIEIDGRKANATLSNLAPRSSARIVTQLSSSSLQQVQSRVTTDKTDVRPANNVKVGYSDF